MYFSATIVRDLIDYANGKGVDTANLENQLITQGRNHYVTYDQVVKTINYLGHSLDDQHLGLHIGEEISLKATAQVDSIMLHSQTLEGSIQNAIKFSKLISDALECSLEITDQYYSVVYQENPNWKVHQAYARRQILDLALYSNVKSLVAYTNYQYYPVCINYHYTRPKSLREYYRLFNCSLKFSRARTEILFERQIIHRHSKRVEHRLLENIKAKAAQEITNLDVENDLIYLLKKSILKHKPYRASIKEVANDLNMSSRTLQRKLKTLNTTFKKVEYALQLRLAQTYLEEKQMSVDEISYLLGFSENSAFTRFFKSLTGQAPIAYRNTARQYL